MNATKDKIRQEVIKDTRILDQLNTSIYTLASHLNQYVDILRQATPVRPNGK